MPSQIPPDTAPARKLQRDEHFASGRTLAEWRGVRRVHRDRRKETDRRACRGRVRERE